MTAFGSAPGECPFCNPMAERIFHDGPLVVGLWDGFPVSPGHALLVPKRHVATWFDATAAERAALMDAVDLAKAEIEKLYTPDGYNIGINAGAAAGQTVFHLHVHLIPRYRGDVGDPRGGVRHVIPGKANYLERVEESAAPYAVGGASGLVAGRSDPLLPQLRSQLAHADAVDIAVAFVMPSGVRLLCEHLQDVLDRGGTIRFLTGDYMDSTDPDALHCLLDLEAALGGSVQLRVFQTRKAEGREVPAATAFHPKSYIFSQRGGAGTAFIGSSNLSRSALKSGVEWNYRVVSSRDARGFGEIRDAFDTLFADPATTELTPEWIEDYRTRRVVVSRGLASGSALLDPEEVMGAPEPHGIQREALAALATTRGEGGKAGLVVLATGLGKTWLSAFDSREFGRVLFVAHREEILGQARRTFRKIRPGDLLGHYTGTERAAEARVLFASIQTLGRQAHLNRFAPDHFDYIVVDEFHLAAAATYRRLLAHFRPKFLLGLTATPERTDGADLLDLCDGNLVYRCDLVDGIRADLLCPFHYYGVPDEVDYQNIPWRSHRFDEEALTTAVATTARAQNALEQLETRGGTRTLAFCVSQRHADFMANFFAKNGKRAVAVHSGAGSAPRAESLERLQDGDLDIVCAVDMFNEGVDLPELDTVMMLRPTESRILWLQQFGRGLRKASPDKTLKVIDYIGNHRTFLIKPQTLFGLPSGDAEIQNLLERLDAGTQEMPPRCEVTYDLAAVDILRGLLRVRANPNEALEAYVRDFTERHGVRPTALEAYRDGYSPRSVRAEDAAWFGLLNSIDVLSQEDAAAWSEAPLLLGDLATTSMEKSFKMVVLLAMIEGDLFPGECAIDDLVALVRAFCERHPKVALDFGDELPVGSLLRSHLIKNPIKAWVGGARATAGPYFRYAAGVFSSTVEICAENRMAFQRLVREQAEWRLAAYMDRARVAGDGVLRIKVKQAGGNPILMPLDREAYPELPQGWTTVEVDQELYEFNFVKIAVNVAHSKGGTRNELPTILRRWFGPNAGAPGRRRQVELKREGEWWMLNPLGHYVPDSGS